jgi:DNA-binding PadR family transcriptional regulator
MPKSGSMANGHAKVCAAAVVALLRGEAPNSSPTLVNTCYSMVSDKHAIHVDPAPDTLLPLPPATFHIMALADEDRHGYAMIQEVAARTGGQLRLSAGTLYRSIQRMLDQGLIAEPRERPAPKDDDGRRRYYRLTPYGRRVAEAEMRRLDGLVKIARSVGLRPERA